MARKKRGRCAYATDPTDGQSALIAPLIPEAGPGARPRRAPTRDLVDAILYFLRAGMAWRLLPHDLPPWQTVYYDLRRWQREGVWDRVHHALVTADRVLRQAQDEGPQAPHPDRHRGTTARREGPCRRHPEPALAKARDRDSAKTVLKASRVRYPFVTRAFADGGWAGRLVRGAKDKAHIVVEVVKRSPAAKGLEVIKRRWVVERTFSWFGRNGRLAKDYENLANTLLAFVTLAAIQFSIRRRARK